MENLYTLSKAIGIILLERGETVSCAESCTGGWISKVITDVSGSSSWFESGLVTYGNDSKMTLLGVKKESLLRFGSVSKEVVSEMAIGAQRYTKSDYAISVSGVAGPEGGSSEKPVGFVCFGFADKHGEILALSNSFLGDRETIRYQSVSFSLRVLHDKLKESKASYKKNPMRTAL